MSKRRAEDDGKSQVHQNIGRLEFLGGSNNYVNTVVYNLCEDEASLRAKEWLATHASELPPKAKSEGFRFEPRLRDKILELGDFQSCLFNTGKTFILQGRPGIGKTTTMQGLLKNLRNEAEDDAEIDPDASKPADDDMDVDSHDSVTDSEPGMFGWFFQFLPFSNSQDLPSGYSKSEQDQTSVAGKLVTAAVYFSTKRVSTDEHAPTKVLLCLLQEVCKQIPSSIETVKRLYERSLTNGIPEADSVRRALGTVLKGAERTCIFIDALEECARTHLEDLLFQLGTLQRETRIGIVLTVVLDVNRRLLEQHFQNRTFHNMSADPRDVKAYIRRRLGNITDERFLENLASGVSTAANGIFLLARLYCTRLNSFEREDDVRRELQAIVISRSTTDADTESEIKSALGSVLERIFHLERTGEDKRIAEFAMGFVRDTHRALSIKELLWLLSIDEHPASSPSQILHKWSYVSSCCYGLIENDGFGNVVFIHRLILQCLEDPDYSGKVRVQHEEFAKRCLYYLKQVDVSEGACLNSTSLEARLGRLPLFDYAARYWHHHVKCSSKNNSHPQTETQMSGCIASIVTNFLDEDAQVEATFQVSLFPPRNPQSYLDNVIKDIPWTEAKLKLMKIDKKITFDPFQPNKMTGLHVACQHGFEEIACKYIQKKKNYEQPLNDTNIHRCTPLHYAVRGKHLHIAKVLLDAGADLNCWDMWGDTPLIISLTQNNLPMAKLLLEPERTDLNINAQTAHVMEFKEHHFKLLMHNGTPDLQDDIAIYYSVSGRTALHQAAKNGMEEIVQLLLTTRKVDFTLQDSAGQLAWHKAAKYGHTKILTLLLAQGLDPLCRIGETRNGIEPGAKIKEYDGHLNTALHVAAKWNKPEVVSYLVDSFPDIVPLQNHLGETALMLAVCMRQGNMVDLLLRKSLLKGVDVGVNIEDKTGRRPIHYSVIDRSGKCMKLLLGREEIEVDVKDRDGMTLLDLAAKYGQACHIEQLLELEIYVERGCEQWRKAFRHANDRSNWRIYRALFSSEKINDLLDADYATLKDMVLSVPKDRLDARSKIHFNETGKPSFPNAQSPRKSRCQTIGTDDETETPLAERVPEFSSTPVVQESEGPAKPVEDELHPESRISTTQSRAVSPYPKESIAL